MSKLSNFVKLAKDFSSVLAIEGRDAVSEGLRTAADKIEPTEQQRRFAASKRNEWEQKAAADAKRKEREKENGKINAQVSPA